MANIDKCDTGISKPAAVKAKTVSAEKSAKADIPAQKVSPKLATPAKTLIDTNNKNIDLSKVNLSESKISVEGQNLIVKSPDGKEIILVNFLSAAKDSNPPSLKLADNTELSAPDLLAMLGKIGLIQTAEGPSEANDGSGFTRFVDDGHLPGVRAIGAGLGDGLGAAGLGDVAERNLLVLAGDVAPPPPPPPPPPSPTVSTSQEAASR